MRRVLLMVVAGTGAGLVVVAIALRASAPGDPMAAPSATSTSSQTQAPASDAPVTPNPAPIPTPAPTGRASRADPTPAPTPVAASSTPPPAREASSVDCAAPADARFCSSTTDGMTIRDGRFVAVSQQTHERDPASPTVTITSRAEQGDGRPAARGDEVRVLRIDVRIENRTEKVFVFPRREMLVALVRDGEPVPLPVQRGESFEMPKGATLLASFSTGIVSDGTYSWRAKTWFYER